MPIVELATLADPRLAPYLGVRDPDLLRRHGQFLAEGRLVVERLIAIGQYEIDSLLLSPAAVAAMERSLERLPPAVPVFTCTPRHFAELCGVNIHRGCLALARRQAPRSLAAVTASARTLLVLEGVSNPDNVGGIFRNAAAFGVDGVILGPGCGDPYYRKSIRTSVGAALQVPFVQPADGWPLCLISLREAGFVVAALTPDSGSVSLDAFAALERPRRMALLLGAEGEGLSAAAKGLADVRVRIPIARGVDSLNVAVASGIALSRLGPDRM